jgi:hypothetical protein
VIDFNGMGKDEYRKPVSFRRGFRMTREPNGSRVFHTIKETIITCQVVVFFG